MRHEIRLIQEGSNALGHHVGIADGLWGPKTLAGLTSLLGAKEGRWGDPVTWIHGGLIDLGYLPEDNLARAWTPSLDLALRWLIAADGRPRSGAVIEAETLEPGNGGWVSHERRLFQGSAQYLITLFVLHTTATSSTWWKGKSNRRMFEDVRIWHLGNGWRDIGYHGLICPDGEVIEGRKWGEIGAHVVDHNRGSLGYSMVPIKTIDRMGQPSDFYTAATLAAMRRVVAKACNETQITRISGHNEFANKLCPGFRVVDRDWAPAGWAA